MRYLDRIKRLSEKQKKVYQMNILKHDFVSEKEKYARHIEKGVMVHLPINTSTTP
jgi:protein involved in sex pheromone biosynthesis